MPDTIIIRPSLERGHADHGWLNTYHSFSFADYYDPQHMGFRLLRVINEDRIGAGMGFGMHPHRDMEIVTIVLEGALEHKDSMGNSSVIRPGEVQRMTAGTGVTHSEFNHSKKDPAHILQIWILPAQKGLKPGYEQKSFDPNQKKDRLQLLASVNGRGGSVTVHQDIDIYDCALAKSKELTFQVEKDRGVWVQVKKGNLAFNDSQLGEGDGASIEVSVATALRFQAKTDCEFLLFDLTAPFISDTIN